MFLTLEQIQTIQLDHTSRCNLACPQCGRFQNDWITEKKNQGLDLDVDDYRQILEPFPPGQISIFHCGNFGDAIASPTFEKTFAYCLDAGVKRIKISTNGSLRSPEWWRNLAELGGKRLVVIFAIDGLEETNHIYRANSSWKRIMANAQAFIESGGQAHWDFIEFEHNYHQIEEAKMLAQNLGFQSFNVKYTGRFAINNTTEQQTPSGKILKDRKTNLHQKDLNNLRRSYSSFSEYIKKTNVSCKYKNDRSVFIDFNMKLWPCTWTAVFDHFKGPEEHGRTFEKIFNAYGKDFNSLKQSGWEVLNHPFFKDYLEKSWEPENQMFERIYACGRTCGEKYEFSSGYGKNKIVHAFDALNAKG